MQGRGLGGEQGCYPDGCRQRSDRSAALCAVPKPKTPSGRMHMRQYNGMDTTRGLVGTDGGSFPSTPTRFDSYPATPLGYRGARMHTHGRECTTRLLKFQLITVVFRHHLLFSFALEGVVKIVLDDGGLRIAVV